MLSAPRGQGGDSVDRKHARDICEQLYSTGSAFHPEMFHTTPLNYGE